MEPWNKGKYYLKYVTNINSEKPFAIVQTLPFVTNEATGKVTS